ncbi:WbqC family protein [Rhodohalobacter sp. 614A]|uniref:WbqC family protein n=1 Tax=Rhodohalobacter sp. 614A TaxID=2908649 RepID=UPI001F43C2B4|nr:WbqC family protein [Rhodohalobacter sp. 614A]
MQPMKLAILQPTFIPNLHYLVIILHSDLVILQDTETWSRKSRVHRAKIRTPEGTQYINIPVVTEDRDKPIRDVRIDHTENWIEPLLRSLEFNYRNSVYYDFYEPEIRSDFESAEEYNYLLDFNLYLRRRIFRFLELENLSEIILSSKLKQYDPDPDQLAKNLNADQYFQEHSARHYQRQGKNRTEPTFEHPVYRQHFDGFEEDCCLLDLLFQYGPESFRIIDKLLE